MTSYPRAQRVARLIVNPQVSFGTTAVWTDTLINLHPLLGRPDTRTFRHAALRCFPMQDQAEVHCFSLSPGVAAWIWVIPAVECWLMLQMHCRLAPADEGSPSLHQMLIPSDLPALRSTG